MKSRSLNPTSELIREQQIVDAFILERRKSVLDARRIKSHSEVCFDKFGCCIEAHIKTPVKPYDYWLRFARYYNGRSVR